MCSVQDLKICNTDHRMLKYEETQGEARVYSRGKKKSIPLMFTF